MAPAAGKATGVDEQPDAGNEIDVVSGGGYIPQRTGFGVRTDTMIAFQAANADLNLIQIYFG
jgi:hypothetical protein